jgi:hypothetical protein
MKPNVLLLNKHNNTKLYNAENNLINILKNYDHVNNNNNLIEGGAIKKKVVKKKVVKINKEKIYTPMYLPPKLPSLSSDINIFIVTKPVYLTILQANAIHDMYKLSYILITSPKPSSFKKLKTPMYLTPKQANALTHVLQYSFLHKTESDILSNISTSIDLTHVLSQALHNLYNLLYKPINLPDELISLEINAAKALQNLYNVFYTSDSIQEGGETGLLDCFDSGIQSEPYGSTEFGGITTHSLKNADTNNTLGINSEFIYNDLKLILLKNKITSDLKYTYIDNILETNNEDIMKTIYTKLGVYKLYNINNSNEINNINELSSYMLYINKNQEQEETKREAKEGASGNREEKDNNP